MKDVSTFFNGMGDGFSKVVVLIVAASTMVAGLKAMGLIDAISGLVTGVENAGAGLMLVFSGITALITFVSGSGNAVFYSFIELIPQIAAAHLQRHPRGFARSCRSDHRCCRGEGEPAHGGKAHLRTAPFGVRRCPSPLAHSLRVKL